MPVHDDGDHDPLVLQLLEEALDSGRSPEQVCADSPDLLPAVRAGWERCRQLDAELSDLFPSSRASPGPPDRDADLPSIPGYAVEAVLGRGGVGVVYRARDLRLKRPVALKMLLSGAFAGRVERARFRREAEAVAALRHASVVQVYEVGEHQGLAYFTMELMDGGSLSERLGGVPLPPLEAAGLVATLAGAVEAAHRAGVVHRDLKPSNVLLAADGTPKIGDFGLALQADGEADLALTLSGARMGTPSYMAPEQAAGLHRGAVGPPTDVYALGAVLYEALTGRPPFRGESAVETERQVVSNDPVPPSRLNPRVARDLETICLKCLAKDPRRRYASAAALAEDLGRFARDEPVTARRAGWLERGAKWVRRRPAAATAMAAVAVIGAAVVGGSLWILADRAAVRRMVAGDLAQAAAAHRGSAWAVADAAIKQAAFRLEAGHVRAADLHAGLEKARRDSDLVRRLDGVRMTRAGTAGGKLAYAEADRQFATLFREAGLGADADDPGAVGARIDASDVRPALVAALYEWLLCAPPDTSRDVWLRAVVRRADPDPTGWRDRALDPSTWLDRAEAAAFAADAAAMTEDELARKPVELLIVVHKQIRYAARYTSVRDSLTFLIRVQRAHPTSFWANLELCIWMRTVNNHAAAVRYGQAAVVLRPQAAVAHDCLGQALLSAGQVEEAILEHREALGIDPDFGSSRANLAAALTRAGRHEEAARELEKCVRQRPTVTYFRSLLADSLATLGRFDEAAEQYRQVIAVQPYSSHDQEKLRGMLMRLGRWDDALAAWRAHMAAQPRLKDKAWAGYAECCLFRGDADEYRRTCAALLDQAERSTDPREWEVVGRTCLLLPAAGADLRRATALIDRALAADRARPTGFHPHFRAAKGLADFRAGRYDEAVATMEGDAAGVHGPLPQLVVAMARSRQGKPGEARAALARAVVSFDWSPGNADTADEWMYHVLRREAEVMILPDLAAFLAGTHEPKDVDERLAMTGACQFLELHAARARLWAGALADDPGRAGAGRAHAVPAAVLAGLGLGEDAHTLTEEDRRRWRARARQWFHEELATASATSSPDGGASREAAKASLAAWSTSPALSGLREPAALARLPADEQREWAELWDRAAPRAGRATGNSGPVPPSR